MGAGVTVLAEGNLQSWLLREETRGCVPVLDTAGASQL